MRLFRERRHVAGLAGGRRHHEIGCCGIYLYRRTVTQKWSPSMTEWHFEYGVRVGYFFVSMRVASMLFKDGKTPKIVKGEF
jgi:hypothetical protein